MQRSCREEKDVNEDDEEEEDNREEEEEDEEDNDPSLRFQGTVAPPVTWE